MAHITLDELEARHATLIKERQRRAVEAVRDDHGYAVVIGELERMIGSLLAQEAEENERERAALEQLIAADGGDDR